MKKLRSIKVDQVMTKEVVSVDADTLAGEVHELFKVHNIHHIPVVSKEGKILGIISRQDVNMLLDWGTQLNLNSSSLKNEKILTTMLAADIMQKKIFTIDKEFTLSQVSDIFLSNAFHGLPVVDNDKVIGIITTYDLIKVAYSK